MSSRLRGFEGESAAQMMGKRKISKENRAAMVAAYRARIASLSPEERKAMAARLNTPEIIAGRHQMMLDRWAKSTPEERVKACAHLTTPEMQAKSHAAISPIAAKRTPATSGRASSASGRRPSGRGSRQGSQSRRFSL